MNDLPNFERIIREKLDVQQERIRQEKHVLEERMHQLDQRQTNFDQTAEMLMQTVIRPHMEKLAEFFANAEIAPIENGSSHHSVCSFQHTSEYPATVKLDLGIGHDDAIENLLLMYNLEVRPIFFRFDGHHEAAFPLTSVDTEQVSEWVDERIVEFVDTYLKLAQTEQYQKETLVTDPVCKMRIRKRLETAEETYHGKKYHFCTDRCRSKFVADPLRYVSTVETTPFHQKPGQGQKEELQREADEIKEIGATIEKLKRRTGAHYGAK